MTQPLLEGKEEKPDDLQRMSLLQHLEELRNRIFRSLIVFVVGFFLCWGFSDEIYRFLSRPIRSVENPETGAPLVEKLSFLGVTDPFILYVKVAALAAVFLTSPFILYQIWRFVAPGLYRREKRYAVPFVFFGSTFFLAGGVFAYYVAFPFAVEFLLLLGQDFEPAVTVDRYFRFLMTVILGLGVMFELPILIFLLSQIGVVTPRFLIRHFRWAVLAIFMIAAIITPTPDVFNLLIFAVPTLVLYVLGVAAAALVHRKKTRE